MKNSGYIYAIIGLVALLAFAGLANGVTITDYSGASDDSTDDGSTDDSTSDNSSDQGILGFATGGLVASLINEVANVNTPPKIQLFWEAIGFAEGFGPAGNIPTIANNRGDLSKGDFGDTGKYVVAKDGEQVIVYPDLATGDAAGYEKLQNIVDGGSSVYSLSMTILQMGQKWAGSASVWASNVVAYLNQNGVNATINTPLSEVLT